MSKLTKLKVMEKINKYPKTSLSKFYKLNSKELTKLPKNRIERFGEMGNTKESEESSPVVLAFALFIIFKLMGRIRWRLISERLAKRKLRNFFGWWVLSDFLRLVGGY